MALTPSSGVEVALRIASTILVGMNVAGCRQFAVTPVPSSRSGEVERVNDLRELALAVGAHAVITTLEHQIIEVDRDLTRGSDVHDPGGRGALRAQARAAP